MYWMMVTDVYCQAVVCKAIICMPYQGDESNFKAKPLHTLVNYSSAYTAVPKSIGGRNYLGLLPKYNQVCKSHKKMTELFEEIIPYKPYISGILSPFI